MGAALGFEHDITEINGHLEQKLSSNETSAHGTPRKYNTMKTVWNAKVILMSGIGTNVLEDMWSNKSFAERPPHYNNVLRFAVLKKDRSFMAVGGSWSKEIDGGDPSVDYTVLVQTALRHMKETIQVDLSSCLQWNRLLEIHYERVGKNELFSHEEICVYFIPNLTDCLPLLDTWRSQWVAQRALKLKREQLHLKREKSTAARKKDPKGSSNNDKVDDRNSPKSMKGMTMDSDAIKPSENVNQETSLLKDESVKETKVGNLGMDVKKTTVCNSKAISVNVDKDVKDQKPNESNSSIKAVDSSASLELGTQKSGNKPASKNVNKKIVPVKEGEDVEVELGVQKSGCKPTSENATKRPVSVKEGKDVEVDQSKNEKIDTKEATDYSESVEAEDKEDGKKPIVRKTVAKKVPIRKPAPKAKTTEVNKIESKDNEANTKETSLTKLTNAVETEGHVEETPKRKVIKKKVKRMVVSKTKNISPIQVDNIVSVGTMIETENEGKAEVNEKFGNNAVEGENAHVVDDILVKERDVTDSMVMEEATHKCIVLSGNWGTQEACVDQHDPENDNQSYGTLTKDGKAVDSREQSSTKEKLSQVLEKPPKYPGLFLNVSQTKEFKLQSTTFSLDGLLDYSERDTEESAFELSLFGEVFYEMLQYKMGCLILAYLQRLQLKYVNKRVEEKRPRSENPDKESVVQTSAKKRSKISDKLEDSSGHKINEGATVEPKKKTSAVEEDEIRDATSTDKEMKDASFDKNSLKENDREEMVDDNGRKIETPQEIGQDGKVEMGGQHEDKKNPAEKVDKVVIKQGEDKIVPSERSDKVIKEIVVDKELLQAFRFFDRNRAGYITVEDLRTVIHNLGKFHSYKYVKELVRNAMLESSITRDNRILYEKLCGSFR